MKVLVLYRPNSEHAVAVESFLRDLERERNVENSVEVVSLDTREGASTASLYDIVRYPGFLVLDNFGSIIRSWQGEPFPMLDEIVGYATS